MPDRDALLLFLATGLALNLTPGPDMLYVAARSTSEGRAAGVASASRGAEFRQGVVTNVLNPKVALFFLAFLPQFVDPARGSAAPQVLALGLLFDTSGTIVNLAVALGASGAAGRLRRGARAARLLERATGALFVALGVRLALAGRR